VSGSPPRRVTFRIETIGTLATLGARAAAEALSLLAGSPGRADGGTAAVRPLEDVVALLGREDEPVVAVHCAVRSTPGARLLIAFTPEAARWLPERLEGGTPRGGAERRRSILLEAGNILTGAFLSAIAGHHVGLLTTPPAIASDMAGALLDGPLVDIAEGRDRALVLECPLELEDGDGRTRIGRVLLLLPPDAPATLMERGS